MKLAEALILRADIQKKIEQTKARLINNALIQEGDSPSEDPKHLLKEIFAMQKELSELIKRINKTNNTTQFSKEINLSDALVERDMLLEKRSTLSSVASQASVRADRYSKTEIKFISTVDVKEIQKEIDAISKEYRELDTQIQALNWNTELV